MFFLSLCHFYLLFKNYISWSLEVQDFKKHPVENHGIKWQSDKKSPAFWKEFCCFGISCVRDTMILEVEIDETTKEDMIYGVKTNHIPKGYEKVKFFDGWRYVLNTWRFFRYVLENISVTLFSDWTRTNYRITELQKNVQITNLPAIFSLERNSRISWLSRHSQPHTNLCRQTPKTLISTFWDRARFPSLISCSGVFT